jgi:(p)ppGpp synthase/HD superfamily hydrolase
MFEMNIIEQAKEYAINCHSSTNHLYGDGRPYSYHLEMVANFARMYALLLDDDLRATALCVAYTHDVIEDCRQTYNNVKDNLGYEIAEATYALTNEKGKNRDERGNAIYYEGIRMNKVAHFVKICDRLANVQYSVNTKSSMINAYRKENGKFQNHLYTPEYDAMFNQLDYLLNKTI